MEMNKVMMKPNEIAINLGKRRVNTVVNFNIPFEGENVELAGSCGCIKLKYENGCIKGNFIAKGNIGHRIFKRVYANSNSDKQTFVISVELTNN